MQNRPPSTEISRMAAPMLRKDEDPLSSPRRDSRTSKPKKQHNKSTSADVELKLADASLRRAPVGEQILITKEELSALEKNNINQLLDEPAAADARKKPRREKKDKDDTESVVKKRHKSRPVARSHSNKEDSTKKDDIEVESAIVPLPTVEEKRKDRKQARSELPPDRERKARSKTRPSRKTSDKSNTSNSGGEGKALGDVDEIDEQHAVLTSSNERKAPLPVSPRRTASRHDEAHSTSDNDDDDLMTTAIVEDAPPRVPSNPTMENGERPPKIGDDSDDDTASFFANYDSRRHRLSTSSISRIMGNDISESDSLESSVASAIRSPLRSRQHSRSRVRSISEDQLKQQDERIRINVGGRVFESYASTLRKYPNTLLGTMLHPRNARLLKLNQSPNASEDLFFDRNPRVFEVILDFYRTGQLNRPHDVPLEMLKEELAFFQIELPEHGIWNKRISMELIKLEYKNILLPAEEYRKMMRHKLLSEHIHTIVRVLDFIQQKIERKARSGHNSCTITFYSPLHYTNNTPNEIFKVISTNEIRDMLVELLRSKDFTVKETNEYSKTKATSIIGLHDQVVNYNDPKFFAFQIKW